MRRCRLVVTGQSLFGGVHLEAVCQLVRAAQRGGVPAVDFVGGDAQTLPGDAAKEMQWKQVVVATDQDPRWGVPPGSERRRFPIRASDWMRARFSAWAASSGGTSW
jgi:hypothetical protein